MSKKSWVGLGNLVNLTPITTTNTTTTNTTTTATARRTKPKTPPKTRIIRISENLYERFREHSRKYYDVEPYETILENLLDNFDKHNQDKRWWNNNNNNNT